MYYLDHIDVNRGSDVLSTLHINELNFNFDDVEEVAQEVEESYNKIDFRLLEEENKKNLKELLHVSSRLREKDKLFMNATKVAFAQVNIAHRKEVVNRDSMQFVCQSCDEKFPTKYAVDSHKCSKRWVCQVCNAKTTNEYNYKLHVKRGCQLHSCKKCFHKTYSKERFEEHKKKCTTVICESCGQVCQTLTARRKHKRKYHSQ